MPLPQLIGLSEEDARTWAEESGFEVVFREDEDHPDILDPSRRLFIEVGFDGTVTNAYAG